jgi:hypothetical protein
MKKKKEIVLYEEDVLAEQEKSDTPDQKDKEISPVHNFIQKSGFKPRRPLRIKR